MPRSPRLHSWRFPDVGQAGAGEQTCDIGGVFGSSIDPLFNVGICFGQIRISGGLLGIEHDS
jgi:hypothetical protein